MILICLIVLSSNRVSRRLGPLTPSATKRGLCVAGRCEYFSCTPDSIFKEDPEICTLQTNRARVASNLIVKFNQYADGERC